MGQHFHFAGRQVIQDRLALFQHLMEQASGNSHMKTALAPCYRFDRLAQLASSFDGARWASDSPRHSIILIAVVRRVSIARMNMLLVPGEE